MPDTDSSHTASGGPRKEELASLYAQWDRPDASAPSRERVQRQGLWLRGAVTLGFLAVAAVVMFATRDAVAFWAEPGAPRDLGSLRARWSAREPSPIGPPNGHVAMRELVPTRVVPVAAAATPAPEEVRYLFFCPLYDVVVLTRTAIALDAAHASDPRLAPLVAAGKASPAEAGASADVEGRLLRGDAAPAELAPFVESFARRVEKTPAELWVLIDGARPSDATWAAVLWALAAASPLLSLVFFLRALRALRKHSPEVAR